MELIIRHGLDPRTLAYYVQRANANRDGLQGRRVFAWHARHPPRAPPRATKPRPRVCVGLMRAQRRWRPAPQPTGAQPTHLLACAKLRCRARAAPLFAPHADERGMCASRWCTARCAAGRSSARHCGSSTAAPLTSVACERTGPCCGPCCGAARALRRASHRTLKGAAYAHRGGALRARFAAHRCRGRICLLCASCGS
jgi:hypothetical protein